MARLIGGIGTSHIPSLGPVIDRRLTETPEWKPFFDDYQPVRRWLESQAPDLAIVVYNDHGCDFFLDKMPTFAVGAAPSYPPGDQGWDVRRVPDAAGDLAFSQHAIEHLIEAEFDVTICQELHVDHGFHVPMSLLFGDEWPVRVLPIVVNVIQHPVPTPLRCYKFGQALRRAVDTYPTAERVVIVGTGGMSHQLHGERAGFMSQTFDEAFLDAIEADPLALTRITRREYMERAGAEAIELIMWLTMRGALDERVARVHRAYKLGVSLTGSGLIALANQEVA
jgi:protocatechuate 4,5-dioxygenase beta chain